MAPALASPQRCQPPGAAAAAAAPLGRGAGRTTWHSMADSRVDLRVQASSCLRCSPSSWGTAWQSAPPLGRPAPLPPGSRASARRSTSGAPDPAEPCQRRLRGWQQRAACRVHHQHALPARQVLDCRPVCGTGWGGVASCCTADRAGCDGAVALLPGCAALALCHCTCQHPRVHRSTGPCRCPLKAQRARAGTPSCARAAGGCTCPMRPS